MHTVIHYENLSNTNCRVAIRVWCLTGLRKKVKLADFVVWLRLILFYAVMRAVVQRVSHANVTIANTVKGKINKSLLVLLAVEASDMEEDIEWLSGKITRLRIFPDENGVMNRSVQEAGGDILVVSQFTLFASTRKGNRPSYIRSAAPAIAIPIYEAFVQKLTKDFNKPIQTGEFGATCKWNSSMTGR